MIYYKIGCNFDYRLIDGVLRLNEINKAAQINEFYGSDRRHALLTARPAFRLPDIDERYIERFVRRCTDAGIDFNYTLNTMYPGSKRLLASSKTELSNFIKFLDGIGVKIVTVTNPLLAIFVRKVSETIEIEVSTIAHIDAVTQIKAWRDQLGATRVCGNLLKNRCVRFLRNAARYCIQNGITLNLMVNEFCGVGGAAEGDAQPYGTHCIYRDSCYLCHAENTSCEDDELFGFYPMGYCISSRSDPSIWLKMPFIRPEDIEQYWKIGINHFKITGRTGTTEYILKVAEAYIKGSWDGNLLALWKPLETIFTGENELTFKQPYFIDNKQLSGFVDHWFENEEHDCASELCGETCTYCNEFYRRVIQA